MTWPFPILNLNGFPRSLEESNFLPLVSVPGGREGGRKGEREGGREGEREGEREGDVLAYTNALIIAQAG